MKLPPKNLDDFLKIPPDLRRRVFSELPPAVRSAIVTEHYRRVLRGHPEFTEAQKFVLAYAIERATPELYAAVEKGDPAAVEKALSIEREIMAVFSEEQWASISLMEAPQRK